MWAIPCLLKSVNQWSRNILRLLMYMRTERFRRDFLRSHKQYSYISSEEVLLVVQWMTEHERLNNQNWNIRLASFFNLCVYIHEIPVSNLIIKSLLFFRSGANVNFRRFQSSHLCPITLRYETQARSLPSVIGDGSVSRLQQALSTWIFTKSIALTP